MIDINTMEDNQRIEYIFGPTTNRFDWLERALVGDIQTFLNARQNAKISVVGGWNLSIAILVCIGIELASALYTGKTKYVRGYSAEDNVEKFISDIFPGHIRCIPRIIWDGVRNGIDHLFIPKVIQYCQTTIQFSFYVEGESVVSKSNGLVEIMINSIEFFHALEGAIQNFKQKLQNNNTLQSNFITAWESIESNSRILKPATQKSNEAEALLSELDRVGSFRLF